MECLNCGKLVFIYEHNTILKECVIQDQIGACHCGELVGKTFYSTIRKEYVLFDNPMYWGQNN